MQLARVVNKHGAQCDKAYACWVDGQASACICDALHLHFSRWRRGGRTTESKHCAMEASRCFFGVTAVRSRRCNAIVISIVWASPPTMVAPKRRNCRESCYLDYFSKRKYLRRAPAESLVRIGHGWTRRPTATYRRGNACFNRQVRFVWIVLRTNGFQRIPMAYMCGSQQSLVLDGWHSCNKK